MKPRHRLAASLLVLGAGCSGEAPNPFASRAQTAVPPPSAALFVMSGVYTTRAAAPRELYAAAEDGTALTRLTFCNAEAVTCDNLEVLPSPDRSRVIVLRVTDSNGDRALNPATDGAGLVFVDLSRSVEGPVVAATERVNGADWSRVSDVVAYSATGPGGLEDLFRVDPNGANVGNLTGTATVRERRPRIDPSGRFVVYERIEAGGKSQIFVYNNQLLQVRLTTGAPGTEALAGTPYVVGADADPDYSPDARTIVFRRLTGTGNGGLGTWDLMTVGDDGTRLTTIASGPVFRGAPDWGRQGIVFTETDVAAGRSELVLVQPDGSGRRVLISQGSSFGLGFPRWLQ